MSHFEGVIEGVIEGVGKDIKEKLASILCALNEQPGLRDIGTGPCFDRHRAWRNHKVQTTYSQWGAKIDFRCIV